jgi:hypothetical protein
LKTVDTSHASMPQTPVDQNANASITSTDETSQIQNAGIAAKAFEEEIPDRVAVMRNKLFK